MTTRSVRVLLVAGAFLTGLILCFAVILMVSGRVSAPSVTQIATIGGPFSLTDQNGRTVTDRDLKGHPFLVFFGFTHCPDVCPTTLATLAAVRTRLRDLPAAERPGAVFVSVDPVRDTPEALARYVPHFDPEFVGVTGEPAAIAALTRELGIAVVIGEPGSDGAYTVDHTAALLLVDPDAAWAAVFGTPHAADTIAGDFRAIAAAR